MVLAGRVARIAAPLVLATKRWRCEPNDTYGHDVSCKPQHAGPLLTAFFTPREVIVVVVSALDGAAFRGPVSSPVRPVRRLPWYR